MIEAFGEFATAMVETLQSTFVAIKKFYAVFHEMLWQSYEKEGAPYGLTDEGMWRWAREKAEIERLRQNAIEMECYHRQMADFRKIMHEQTGDSVAN